jgi:hypothetical protein
MHYANGREAKNGDKVVLIPRWTDSAGKVHVGAPMIGILYDAQAGNDFCNGKIAPIAPNDPCPNLKECLHFEDVVKALPENVPDSSKAPAADHPAAADQA